MRFLTFSAYSRVIRNLTMSYSHDPSIGAPRTHSTIVLDFNFNCRCFVMRHVLNHVSIVICLNITIWYCTSHNIKLFLFILCQACLLNHLYVFENPLLAYWVKVAHQWSNGIEIQVNEIVAYLVNSSMGRYSRTPTTEKGLQLGLIHLQTLHRSCTLCIHK